MLSVWPLLVASLLPRPQKHEPAHGDVALFGEEIEALPQGQLFGGSVWCEADEDDLLEFRVTPSPEGIQVLASFTMPGFHWEWVRLRLSESGTQGDAFFAMDVPMGALRDLSGVAVLLTDGKDSVLEFEVTCTQSAYNLIPHFGRVHVGPEGVALAKKLAARTLNGPYEAFHERRSNEWPDEQRPELRFTARGYVDSWGRRQGPWLYTAPNGRTVLETTWRDGRASGPLTRFDSQGVRRGTESLVDGFLDGVSCDWREDGTLRAYQEYSNGREHGWRVLFAPDGTKERAWRYEKGREVGAKPLFEIDDAAQIRRLERFHQDIAAFHTRSL